MITYDVPEILGIAGYRPAYNMKKTSNPKYRVKRVFLAGSLLAGLTHTEITTVKFDVGFTCLKPVGGSAYRIVACDQVTE